MRNSHMEKEVKREREKIVGSSYILMTLIDFMALTTIIGQENKKILFSHLVIMLLRRGRKPKNNLTNKEKRCEILNHFVCIHL